MQGKKLTLNDFIERSKVIHNNKYSYTDTILGKNNKEKVIIICPIHDKFNQTPDSHLLGKGCKKCAGVKLKTKHGMRFNKFYHTWDSMMQRCNNSNSTNYKNYGARGICVSEEFKNCKLFIDYIESLPNYTNGKQIDRINNDKNYERGNLKWSTSIEQNLNKRIKSDNTSGYTGVARSNNSLKWRSYIYLDSKTQIRTGIFNTIKEAVDARNNYIIKNKLNHKIQKYE